MKNRKLTLAIGLALVLSMQACGITIGKPADIAAGEATAEVPVPSATPMVTETVAQPLSFIPSTYIDEAAGFEFDYPVDWSIDPGSQIGVRGSQAMLTSPGTTFDTLAEGGSRVIAVTFKFDPKNDLNAFVEQRKAGWSISGFQILSEEQVTLVDGRPAVKFFIQTLESQTFFMFTTVGDDYLSINGDGDLALVAEIAQTVRPLG